MKKRNFKLLVLNKKSISSFALKGGLPATQTCVNQCVILDQHPGNITIPTEIDFETTSDYIYYSQMDPQCAQAMSQKESCVSVIDHNTCHETC